MKTLITTMFLASALIIPVPAFASDGGPGEVSISTSGPSRVIAFGPTEITGQVPTESSDVEIGQVLAEASEVIATATQLKTGKFLAIAAFLAALFKLLLSMLKLTSGFFRNKAVPKVAALALGVGVALFASFAGGVGWLDALILMASGPGAIAIHEISKLIPAVRAIKDSEESSSHSE